jgi:hypothetical protein
MIEIGSSPNSTSNDFMVFRDWGGASVYGSIDGNGSTGVRYNTTSDARLKENVKPFSGGLDLVDRMDVRTFNFIGTDKTEIGFLAQELYDVYPEVVAVGGADPRKDPWNVEYGRLTPVLVSAIQEQQAEIAAQAARIDELLKRVETLEAAR